jgi:hypothetical protein
MNRLIPRIFGDSAVVDTLAGPLGVAQVVALDARRFRSR